MSAYSKFKKIIKSSNQQLKVQSSLGSLTRYSMNNDCDELLMDFTDDIYLLYDIDIIEDDDIIYE